MNKKDILKVLEESNKVSSNLTDKQIEQYHSEAHKKQNIERASKGGSITLPKGIYTDIQKKGNQAAKDMGVGIHNKENPNYKKWKSEAGKKGVKKQMEKGLGIHTDAETRKEWSRLGGLKSISHLNRERECPYCKIITKGAAYNRWHGDNCKNKK